MAALILGASFVSIGGLSMLYQYLGEKIVFYSLSLQNKEDLKLSKQSIISCGTLNVFCHLTCTDPDLRRSLCEWILGRNVTIIEGKEGNPYINMYRKLENEKWSNTKVIFLLQGTCLLLENINRRYDSLSVPMAGSYIDSSREDQRKLFEKITTLSGSVMTFGDIGSYITLTLLPPNILHKEMRHESILEFILRVGKVSTLPTSTQIY